MIRVDDCVRPPRNEDKIQHLFRACARTQAGERKSANFPGSLRVATLSRVYVILSRRCSSIVICGNNSAREDRRPKTKQLTVARTRERISLRQRSKQKKKFLHKKLSQIRLLCIYIFSGVREMETRSSIYTPTDQLGLCYL